MSTLDRYECDGQMNIFDFIPKKEPIFSVDIKGICDDPFCPKCGYEFWTCTNRSEIDCERCPSCGIRVDWSRWHFVNDEDLEESQNE